MVVLLGILSLTGCDAIDAIRSFVHRLDTFGSSCHSSEVGVYAYAAAQVKKAMEVS